MIYSVVFTIVEQAFAITQQRQQFNDINANGKQ